MRWAICPSLHLSWWFLCRVGSEFSRSGLRAAGGRPGTRLAPGRITGRGHRRPRLYRAGNLPLHHWALNIPGVWGQSPHAFGRFEAVDQGLEVTHEFRVVEVRLEASERDDLSVAFGCLALVAFGLVEPAKTLVAVMDGGEACQYSRGRPALPRRISWRR